MNGCRTERVSERGGVFLLLLLCNVQCSTLDVCLSLALIIMFGVSVWNEGGQELANSFRLFHQIGCITV